VDITGALLDGHGENVVREADNGCVLGRSGQVDNVGGLFFFVLLNLQTAEDFILQVLKALHRLVKDRILLLLVPPAIFAPSFRSGFFISLFEVPSLLRIEPHDVRVARLHEPAEIVFRADARFDGRSFDMAPNVVKGDKVRRIDHRQSYRVIHVRNGHNLMEKDE